MTQRGNLDASDLDDNVDDEQRQVDADEADGVGPADLELVEDDVGEREQEHEQEAAERDDQDRCCVERVVFAAVHRNVDREPDAHAQQQVCRTEAGARGAGVGAGLGQRERGGRGRVRTVGTRGQGQG